jgi:hypothetical protein
MKPNATTSTSDSHRTVLMVDGHGHIRTIRKFHQKLWIGIVVVTCCLLFAVAAGWLFWDGLKTQQELRAQIDVLKTRLAEVEREKELLLARAVKAESRSAPAEPVRAPAPGRTRPTPPPEALKDKRAVTPKAAAAPAVTARKEKAPPAPASAPPPEIRVGVEKLKVDYDQAEKTLSAGFVVRNMGDAKAEGRAVVVLSSSQGEAATRLSLPLVALKNDRPRGNRGRRFSISRFMQVKVKRKIAEPGLRFDTADVFVFDMQGELLQEKTFEVAVTIPTPPPPAAKPPVQPEAAAPAAAAPPRQPAAPAPAATDPAPTAGETSNSILAIPSNSEQEPQGGQED